MTVATAGVHRPGNGVAPVRRPRHRATADPAQRSHPRFSGHVRPRRTPGLREPNFNPGPKKYVAFLVEPILGSDGNPVLATPDGTGQVVVTQWMDNLGRNISHTTYNAGLGDTAGQLGITTDVVIESELTFNDWYNDVLGVNMSMWLPIVVNLQADGTYVFDSAVDEPYASKGGFFPIDNQLYGTAGTVYNPGRPQGGGADRNFHFTFEGHWKFPYDASADHFFSFTGDDDVWVFIDGKLVIDLGGRHNPREQTVELNRLGLTDGELYDMAFFYAERHCCQSNIRIQTNLVLVPDPPPTITGSHD